MTTVNGIMFGAYDSYTSKNLIKVLKEKGRYYKCRICNLRYVQEKGGLCNGCKYKANQVLKVKEEN